MEKKTLYELGWIDTWNPDILSNGKLLLWLPVDRDETIITTENNYGNILFKGIIHSDEEITFITKILTKTDEL